MIPSPAIRHFLAVHASGAEPKFTLKEKPDDRCTEQDRWVIRFLTYQPKAEQLNSRESVCLCFETPCPRKKDDEEDPECPHFAFGACVAATHAATGSQQLSLSAIGLLSGMSKQGIERHVTTAQRRLIAEIRRDPDLRDYCVQLGLSAKGG